MTNQPHVVQLLCDLIALPSVNTEGRGEPSGPRAGEGRVADYVQRYFEPYGVRIERQQVYPGRENVLVHVPGADPAAAPLLLEAHMDTVDVEGMDEPFTPRIESGRVYGRGACDTKGALAAEMAALGEVLGEGVTLSRGHYCASPSFRRGCVLAATVDEEFTMGGIRRLVESGLSFAGAVVGEPTGLKVVAATDGHMYFRITTHGQSAHTASPRYGVNAIYLMNDVIRVLRQRADSVYPQRQHPLCGSPKLTVSIIQGGASEHIVPDTCQIAIDCRVIPGETCAGTLQEIQAWLASDLDAPTFARVEFGEPSLAIPPLETAVDHWLVRGLHAAAGSVLSNAQVAGVPYNTNASHLAAAGVPSVVFGPGDIAQAHATVEFVEVEQVVAAAETIKSFLLHTSGEG
jgi:succinyl-diaminopimelate desuccinylase